MVFPAQSGPGTSSTSTWCSSVRARHRAERLDRSPRPAPGRDPSPGRGRAAS
jgi:hypothetical protein